LLDQDGYLPPPPGEEWDELDEATQYVAKHASFYQLIDTAIATPGRCVYVTDFRPGGIALRHIDGIRSVSRVLALRAFVNAHRGYSAAAVSDIRGLFVMAETLKSEALISSPLVRADLIQRSLLYLEHLLPSVATETEQLAKLQEQLEEIDLVEGLRAGLIGSRAAIIESLQTSMSSQLRGVWHGDDMLSVLIAFSEVEDALQQDWPAPLALADEYPQDLHFGKVGSLSPWGQNDVGPSFSANMVASRVVRIAKVTARLRAATAALAAVRYHTEHGSWPESLEMLSPTFMREVPSDPFTGKPLKMLMIDGELIIYSVGENLLDDGGAEGVEPNPDQVEEPSGSPDIAFRVKLD
jgi:hypothetical protein